MKTRTTFLIALLILSAMLFVGCMKTTPSDKTDASQAPSNAPAESEPSSAPAESEPSTVPDPIGPMWLVWNGMSVRPYTDLLYGQSYVEHDDGTSGFLHADGAAFFEGILGKVDEMPEVSKDFELYYDRDCSFKYANVYSLETNDRLYENVDLKKLDILLGVMDEDLIVEIAVYEQGRYIESKDKYEYNVYSCSFILRLGGNEGGSLNKTPSGK